MTTAIASAKRRALFGENFDSRNSVLVYYRASFVCQAQKSERICCVLK